MEREGRASVKTPLLDHGSERGIVKHPFPMNWFLSPWKLGQWVYQIIKFGIVQYVSFYLGRKYLLCSFVNSSFPFIMPCKINYDILMADDYKITYCRFSCNS